MVYTEGLRYHCASQRRSDSSLLFSRPFAEDPSPSMPSFSIPRFDKPILFTLFTLTSARTISRTSCERKDVNVRQNFTVFVLITVPFNKCYIIIHYYRPMSRHLRYTTVKQHLHIRTTYIRTHLIHR